LSPTPAGVAAEPRSAVRRLHFDREESRVVLLHQSSPHLLDRSTGALLGLVLGDAMGSPGRGRPQGQVRGHFGWITDLLALPQGAGSVSAPTRSAFHLAAHWPETPEPPRRRRQHGRLRTSITAHHLLPRSEERRVGYEWRAR